MIDFDDMDNRLEKLGKDRAWLASATKRSPGAIRAALAPKALPKSRSTLLQKALSDVIEAEEAKSNLAALPQPELPPGYSAIFLDDEELDRADQASRLIEAPSLAAFCHDVIQAEARRIIKDFAVKRLLAAEKQAQPNNIFYLDLYGGVAAGERISAVVNPEPVPVQRQYPKDHYALRVFGASMEKEGDPRSIPDGSLIAVRALTTPGYPKQGTTIVYSDGMGSTLKLFGYRKATRGEEEFADRFGNLPTLSSLNPDFPEVQTMEGGKIDAVFVEVIAE